MSRRTTTTLISAGNAAIDAAVAVGIASLCGATGITLVAVGGIAGGVAFATTFTALALCHAAADADRLPAAALTA